MTTSFVLKGNIAWAEDPQRVLSVPERLERALYLSGDLKVVQKYVNGAPILEGWYGAFAGEPATPL